MKFSSTNIQKQPNLLQPDLPYNLNNDPHILLLTLSPCEYHVRPGSESLPDVGVGLGCLQLENDQLKSYKNVLLDSPIGEGGHRFYILTTTPLLLRACTPTTSSLSRSRTRERRITRGSSDMHASQIIILPIPLPTLSKN